MNNYIKSIIKKKKQIALTVISAMIVIVLIMGQDRFREHVRADDRVQVEDTGIVLSNILYTLYPDGTAEVTQVGAD